MKAKNRLSIIQRQKKGINFYWTNTASDVLTRDITRGNNNKIEWFLVMPTTRKPSISVNDITRRSSSTTISKIRLSSIFIDQSNEKPGRSNDRCQRHEKLICPFKGGLSLGIPPRSPRRTSSFHSVFPSSTFLPGSKKSSKHTQDDCCLKKQLIND